MWVDPVPLLAKEKKHTVYNPYQLVGRGGEKSLTLKLSIKFLLVLTNATGGDRHVGVGFKLPMKIGWSDNQESVEPEPVLIGRKSVAWQRFLNSQYQWHNLAKSNAS